MFYSLSYLHNTVLTRSSHKFTFCKVATTSRHTIRLFYWSYSNVSLCITNLCFWRDIHGLDIRDCHLARSATAAGVDEFDFVFCIGIPWTQQVFDGFIVDLQEAGFNGVLTGEKVGTQMKRIKGKPGWQYQWTLPDLRVPLHEAS